MMGHRQSFVGHYSIRFLSLGPFDIRVEKVSNALTKFSPFQFVCNQNFEKYVKIKGK